MKNAVKLDSTSASAWNNLGVAFSGAEEYVAGINAFRHAVSLKKDYYVAWVNLGLCYENLGYHKQAAEAIAMYLKYAPQEVSDREFMERKVKELQTMANKPDTLLQDSLLTLPE